MAERLIGVLPYVTQWIDKLLNVMAFDDVGGNVVVVTDTIKGMLSFDAVDRPSVAIIGCFLVEEVRISELECSRTSTCYS